ncbi:complement C3 [Chanos chanos]|uniref:Complement C3 n=1 Tax=Chanos chanos TaxID=29144 RepID=A0A6J2VZ20_CHACN|nr:complement C3-like [Chanos chanos]
MVHLTLLLWMLSLFQLSNSQVNPWEDFRVMRGHPAAILDDYRFRRDRFRHEDTVADLSPKFVILAPNLLRTDSVENIYLKAYYVSEPITVTITIQDFPARALQLMQDSVVLTSDNNFSALRAIQLPSKLLRRHEDENKFVYLTAKFGSLHSAEQVLRVSFQSGYIFIQTDKPIYNPGDKVRCRAFVSTPAFKAFASTISLEFQNPDGIAVHGITRARADEGIFSETYPLSDIVSEGMWKVVAKFDNWKQNIFSAEFEVKKYVLPAFNVTLTPKKSHFSLEDSELVVEVSARYLYDEPVKGTAFVVFGVEVDREKRRLPLMKQVNDLEKGTVSLTLDELKRSYPNIRSLIGRFIYVKASVLTSSGSDLVEAEKSGIKIVMSPYMLSFRNPPKFFKPGMPLDITILVSNHDGSPAPNVPVHVNLAPSPFTLHTGVIRVSLNMPSPHTPQTITVETKVDSLKIEQQAKANLFVNPYRANKVYAPNYLYISTGDNEVSVGQSLNFQLYVNTASQKVRDMIQHITYLVLNKGRIISSDEVKISGQSLTNVALTVTKEMMPSFRFVAYYMIPLSLRSEVVSDSVWVDVEDTCVGSLKVGHTGSRVSDEYRPGSSFRFQVRGDLGAKVSLVAVDNAVFLLSKNRLTQKKIWDIVDRGDMGCTSGGGSNYLSVFTDAGLQFYSSNAGLTRARQDVECNKGARRRRSAAKLHLRSQLEGEYSDKLLQRCCQDGMREIPMAYTCYRRSFYVTEGWDCILAFLHCCSKYRGEDPGPSRMPPTTLPPTTTTTQTPVPTVSRRVWLGSGRRRTGGFEETLRRGPPGRVQIEPFSRFRELPGLPGPPGLPGLAGPPGMPDVEVASRSVIEPMFTSVALPNEGHEGYDEEDDDYEDPTSIYIRKKFMESWLWTDIKLSSVPESGSSDGLAVHPVETALPDSITQWGVLAISASPVTGFCVADPFNVRTFKPFFVDLRIPHSVARNEHVEIKAVLQNHKDEDLDVIVILEKTEDMCSIAFGQAHRQQVKLAKHSSMVIPYTVIPLKAGELEMEVKVMARGFSGHDGVRKKLRVVVEGVQKTHVQSFVLDPSHEGNSEGNQIIRVDKAQLNSVVPNSQPETFVNIRGNLLADTIDNSITDDSLASLIRMPGGCVEQNLASITLPLIAAHYLDRSKQWESVGAERRVEALKYIQKGYEKQLMYRKKDGSYPPYRKEGTSTWITAYVVKVFSMAYPFISVNEDHLCGPLQYLLNYKQNSQGYFTEDNPVFTTSMTGGIQGAESRATLTAFVLIAMAEAQDAVNCPMPGVKADSGFRRAAQYLKQQFPTLKRPYSVAIACYALAMANQGCMKSQLLKSASPDHTHWPDSDNSLYALEATGYALLALVKGGHMEEAAKPFRWLNEKRRRGGGYGSTQPTMVVLQGLSEYLVKKPPPQNLNLRVALSIPGRKDVKWFFDPKLAYVARSSRVPLDQDFQVKASGNGQGILEVVTVYNELPDVHEKKSCKGFDLDVSITETNEKPPEDVEKSFRLTISVRSLEQRPVRMVILDIGIPTGFEPENKDLELLTNAVDRYISNFQVVDNLSDRASLIVHLFRVSNTETETITFRLNQKFKVGLLQPSIVTAYQYYNTDNRCIRFYSPPENKEQLDQICKDNVCRCTQGDCCTMKTANQAIRDSERKDTACQGIFYVYKVRVAGMSKSQYDKYDMEILQVIKEGTDVGLKEKDRRVFLSHAGCRDSLSLQEGKDYLIMGPPTDVWHAGSETNKYTYILGRNTWVEHWPTERECLADSTLGAKCSQLTKFSTELLNKGCQS